MEHDSLDLVRQAAAKGFRVHPLYYPGEVNPQTGETMKGKEPRLSHWLELATSEWRRIKNWSESFPGCNWGLATGAGSGVIVIDVDPQNDGINSWAHLCHGKTVPDTVICNTGGGGLHYYFRYDENLDATNAPIADGVDCRTTGGNVVIPPSTHRSGNPYRWVEGHAPWEIEVAPAPDWLFRRVRRVAKSAAKHGIGDHVDVGERNVSIYLAALTCARNGEDLAITKLRMRDWMDTIGYTDITTDEINKTVDSAYRSVEREHEAGVDVHPTDVGNAHRMIDRYGHLIKYVPMWRQWLIWNEHCWKPDNAGRIRYLATQLVEEMYVAAANAPTKSQREFLQSHAMRSESDTRLNAMLHVAESFIPVLPDDLDADPNKLNAQNGTLSLTEARLLPHRQDDLITRMINVPYYPDAQCPQWEAWLLHTCGGDVELAKYIQRITGRTMFGGNPEQEAYFFYGPTMTGKTTFTRTIQKLLGPYAGQFDIELLLEHRRAHDANDATPALADLHGVRMALGTEMPYNRRLNSSLFKAMCGSDQIAARRLYQDPFTFTPQFIIWMFGNDRANIRPEDEATFRRLRTIPFKVQVDPASVNPMLVEEVFQPEFPGILRWAFDGAIEVYHDLNNRIPLPAVVIAEGKEYQREVDYVQRFFDDCVEACPGEEISSSSMYQAFTTWVMREENLRHPPINLRQFGIRIAKLTNAETRRSGSKTYLIGWRVIPSVMVELQSDYEMNISFN